MGRGGQNKGVKTVIRRHLSEVLQSDYADCSIVIVGAGRMCKKLIRIINRWKNGEIECIFDNNRTGITDTIPKYRIVKPEYMDDKVFVISVQDEVIREQLYNQLKELNIGDDKIISYSDDTSVEYRKGLDKKLYPEEIC